MKKLIITLCFFVISASILAIEPETPPGSGTEKDPYKLSKAEHLVWIKSLCPWRDNDCFCVFTSDIDISSDDNDREEYGFLEFHGSINGQSHSLKINDCLFYEFYGTLDDISIVGCDEMENSFSFYVYGSSFDNISLDNCVLAGTLESSIVKNVKLRNCPLARYSEKSTVDGALIEGTIDDSYSYNTYDDNYQYNALGGCICYGINCIIRNVKSDTLISGYGYIGGIIGLSFGSQISTSFFCGSIDGRIYSGGIVGYVGKYDDQTVAQNCYFDLTHAAANGYGTGVSPAELRRQETFEHWDFENVWEIAEGFSYPTLRDSSSSGTKTIISQGLSIAGISIKGKLSDEELNEIKENPTICLYSEGAGAEITARQELQESKPSSFSYKSKEEAVSISYSGKSKSLKFSSASPQITLGRSSDEGFAPCRLSDCSMKLTSSMTIIKDISEHLRQNGKLSLYDSEIFGNVLGGTTVELKQKGNNLSYKGANGDVKITCKINLKNKMIQIKYISNNVIQPVILCEKK